MRNCYRTHALALNLHRNAASGRSSVYAASWPQAAYHTVTAVVGAGVLGLPFAFSYLGWAVGIIFLAICAAASLYTGWQLTSMHELDGKRLGRYRDLGVHVLGPLWGRVAVVPFQFLVMVRSTCLLDAACRAGVPPALAAPTTRCTVMQ